MDSEEREAELDRHTRLQQQTERSRCRHNEIDEAAIRKQHEARQLRFQAVGLGRNARKQQAKMQKCAEELQMRGSDRSAAADSSGGGAEVGKNDIIYMLGFTDGADAQVQGGASQQSPAAHTSQDLPQVGASPQPEQQDPTAADHPVDTLHHADAYRDEGESAAAAAAAIAIGPRDPE